MQDQPTRNAPPGAGDPTADAQIPQSLLDSIQDVFYRVDRSDRLVLISRSGARLFGYDSIEAVLGRPVPFFWHRPERRAAMLEALRRDGEVREWEAELCRRDGSIITVATTVRALRDARGEETGYEGIFRDITERKRVEEQLRQSEEKFSKVFGTVPDTLVITRLQDGLIVETNPGFEAAIGWTRDEAVGRTSLEIGFWADPADRERMVAELQARGEVLFQEFTFRRKDGALRTGVYSARTLMLGEDACTLFSLQDITVRKQAEEALVHRTRQLEAIRAVSAEIARELDLQKLLDLITRRAVELVAANSGGVHLWDEAAQALFPHAWAGMLAPWQAEVRYRLGEGVVGAAAERREGLIVNDYRSWSGALPVFLQQTDIAAVLAEPLLYQGRLLGVIAITRPTGRPFTEDDQHLLRLFATQAVIAIENARLFSQVTESLREVEKAQDALIQSEKLRALGQMAAGIAHDLNNMLAAILGQAGLIRLRVTEPEVHAALQVLYTAASDGAQIVRRLQAFGRREAGESLGPCDLAILVNEALELTRPRWRDEAQRQNRLIQTRTACDNLPQALGCPAEIREALANLILNAIDAMPEGGILTIAARVAPAAAGEQGSRGAEEIVPLQFVELTVSDTGIGMPPEVQARIFEPFFTTKGAKGTGLGLPMVYGTMKRHGGTIEVTSAPEQGTTFRLRFQAAPRQPVPAQEPEAPPSAEPTRILMIDDEEPVRQSTASLLRAVGHTVIEAEGGADGLKLFAENPVDLVITDLGMPGMTGWEVAQRIKASRPGMPVVLLTGWGQHLPEQPTGEPCVDLILAKPIRLEELQRTIARLTARGQGDASG